MAKNVPCDIPGVTITIPGIDRTNEAWRKDRKQCDWYCETCQSGFYDQELDQQGLVCQCGRDLVSG